MNRSPFYSIGLFSYRQDRVECDSEGLWREEWDEECFLETSRVNDLFHSLKSHFSLFLFQSIVNALL